MGEGILRAGEGDRKTEGQLIWELFPESLRLELLWFFIAYDAR